MIEKEEVHKIANKIHDILDEQSDDLGFITLVFERSDSETDATMVTNCQKGEVVGFLTKTLSHIMNMDNGTPAKEHPLRDFH